MNKLTYSFLLALTPASILAESPEAPNFDHWYQIEIIVFKQKRPPLSDEKWPLEDIRYPYNMVAIAPTSDDLITPYSLEQVQNLNQTGSFIDGRSGAQNRNALVEDFMFKDFLFNDMANTSHNQQLLESKNPIEPILIVPLPDAGTLEPTAEIETPDIEATPLSSAPISATISEPIIVSDIDFSAVEALLYSTLPQAYRSLAKEAYTLAHIAGSLRRSSKYDLLKHQAWLQPINSKPTPILIQTGDRYDDFFEIDGTLSFSRLRFLHVNANLWFTQFEPRFDQQQFFQTQTKIYSELERNYPELIKAEETRDTHIAVHSFPLHHSRRMRSSVMHFIDHPFFGVLIQIDRFTYSLEDEAEAE